MYPTEVPAVNAGTRFASMLLDHVFMTFIAAFFFVPFIFVSIGSSFQMSHDAAPPSMDDGFFLYLGTFGLALYFCKDSINGRSLAKRILKLQVVDNKTGHAASPLQTVIRNLFCVFWPIEAIVALANPSRRIGDFVAGTRLVAFDPASEKRRVKIWQLIPAVLIPVALLVLFVRWADMGSLKTAPQNHSGLNVKESEKMERLFRDSLGEYLSPDIRIYDSVNRQKATYISVILKLKENYLDNDAGTLHELTMQLIESRYPLETFQGQVKYYYKGPGQMKMSGRPIGNLKIATKGK